MAGTKQARRSPADKYDERRDQLAESALRTLGELGYARASLRAIAANSDFSHGVVHYYFADKQDLIIYCVRLYKAQCMSRYYGAVSEAATAEAVLDAFAANFVQTVVDEGRMHCLWYDLRTQSLFDEGLRKEVMQIDRMLEEMIWQVVRRYAKLAGRRVTLTSKAVYGAIDGVFQQALLGYVTGDESALAALDQQVHDLVPLMLGPAPVR